VRLVRAKAELREALRRPRRRGARIGLVPTMGSLHEGHLSLIRGARRDCEVVVVSLFVNPAQFGPGEDLDVYPRDERRDAQVAAAEGADLLWAPRPEEVYPEGFATSVRVDEQVTAVLCGAPEQRGPSHFHAVATMVTKLFNCVQPEVAFFGQKDAQQAVVIRKMAADLDFPVEIEVLPTVREADGLAMSSRNAYLSPEERRRALALPRALGAAEATAGTGERSASAVVAAAEAELRAAGIEPEYVEARDAEDLSPVERLNGRPVLVAVAATIGKARLIDNVTVN
jgi:pantoate--beta-alanine ligase